MPQSDGKATNGKTAGFPGRRRARFDPGQRQVGKLYAKALLGTSEKQGITEEVAQQFDWLVAEVLDGSPKLEKILASALIAAEEKEGMLDRMFAGRLNLVLLNFLKVVARHGRLDSLRAIHDAMQSARDELLGRVAVEVRTPRPLDTPVTTYLLDRLNQTIGGEPRLVLQEDPDLLGGVVMRIGDTVYDASLSAQLRQAHREMIHRSVYEIQSRRDRFRHSSGD